FNLLFLVLRAAQGLEQTRELQVEAGAARQIQAKGHHRQGDGQRRRQPAAVTLAAYLAALAFELLHIAQEAAFQLGLESAVLLGEDQAFREFLVHFLLTLPEDLDVLEPAQFQVVAAVHGPEAPQRHGDEAQRKQREGGNGDPEQGHEVRTSGQRGRWRACGFPRSSSPPHRCPRRTWRYGG